MLQQRFASTIRCCVECVSAVSNVAVDLGGWLTINQGIAPSPLRTTAEGDIFLATSGGREGDTGGGHSH